MKKTLGELIEPGFSHYRSIGELARTLQFLMSTAHTFRDPGRWGTSGPQEYLCAYGGCVNNETQPWHSGRIVSTNPHVVETTTWQENQDSIRDCILDALCSRYPAELRWRKRHKISLDMMLKFPMAYQNQDAEKKAWAQLMALHGYKLPVSTLNSCHRSVNVLCEPELVISRHCVKITVSVTQRQEMRSRCRSSWDVCFLARDTEYSKPPCWNSRRETFAAFVLRAVEFYKGVTLLPNADLSNPASKKK